MKVIYIIGPFRAATTWGVEQNVRRAEELSLMVANLGAMPLCPHTNTRYFNGLISDKFWLDGTMELARRCDAAICVEGWATSAGSKAEITDFLQRDVPVFYRLRDLADWLKANP